MTRDAIRTRWAWRLHVGRARWLAGLLAYAVLAVPALALWIGVTADAWKHIDGPPTFAWPHDHGAHPDFQSEWWYATGELSDAGGHAFGYQLTLFRRGIERSARGPTASKLRASQVIAGHFALVDIAARDFRARERVRRAGAGLAETSVDDCNAWIEDWEIRRSPDGVLHLRAHDVELALDLELSPSKPLALHGDLGYSRKGPEVTNASAYVSWTRLATRGSIAFDGRMLEVQGESWFDHEWGTSELAPDVVGWDWFGLRLADGRDLMMYRLRRKDGSAIAASSGTIVASDGTTAHLSSEDVECTPLESWTSSATGAAYPIRWSLKVPAHHLELEIRARVAACELDGRASTGVVYWEGPVAVSGSIEGSGYAELTGYGSPLPTGL